MTERRWGERDSRSATGREEPEVRHEHFTHNGVKVAVHFLGGSFGRSRLALAVLRSENRAENREPPGGRGSRNDDRKGERLERQAGDPPVPEFTVPREYVPVLLNAVNPAERDNGGGDAWGKVYENIAEMTIQTRERKTIRISFYDVGKTAAGFTADGVRCFRGGEHKPIFICDEYQSYEDESVLMCHIFREMYNEQKTHTKSDRLTPYIENLQRSRGETPPERR